MCPDALRGEITRHKNLESKLIESDRAFFYSAFRVEEVQ